MSSVVSSCSCGGVWTINGNIRDEITFYLRRAAGWPDYILWLTWGVTALSEDFCDGGNGSTEPCTWSPERLWEPNQRLDIDYRITGYWRIHDSLWIFLRLWHKAFFNSWKHWGDRRLDQLSLRTCSQESRSPWESLCLWYHTVSSCGRLQNGSPAHPGLVAGFCFGTCWLHKWDTAWLL